MDHSKSIWSTSSIGLLFGLPACLPAPRPPSQCGFDLVLESLAAQSKVAVGGVAYLSDDPFIEMRKT
jgi:hypothetical protein